MNPRAQAFFFPESYPAILAALEYFRLHPDETKCYPEDEPLTLEIVSIEELPPHIQHLLP